MVEIIVCCILLWMSPEHAHLNTILFDNDVVFNPDTSCASEFVDSVFYQKLGQFWVLL